MSEILPVDSLVQALSISCLKGSNTTAPFFPSILHTGEPSYSNPSTSQESKCIHAAAQSLQVAHPMPSSSAWHPSTWSLPLLTPHLCFLLTQYSLLQFFQPNMCFRLSGLRPFLECRSDPSPPWTPSFLSGSFEIWPLLWTFLKLPVLWELKQTQLQPSLNTYHLVLQSAEITVISSARLCTPWSGTGALVYSRCSFYVLSMPQFLYLSCFQPPDTPAKNTIQENGP